MGKGPGVTVSWRDDGGTLRRRWFRDAGEAQGFQEQITGAPGMLDYLSDIVGELEQHRVILEAMRNALDRIADSAGTL